MNQTIATICARGGSKGLPGKNIREFAGKPLIVHSIEQALACPAIDTVYVSTDDACIADVARAAGATVPYLRPAELASDTASKLPTIEHMVQHLERNGIRIECIVDLQPTSPLRDNDDITRALLKSPKAPLVVSVREASDNPYFNLVERGADGWMHLSKGGGNVRRQDAPKVYALNGSIYVWQRAALAQAAVNGLWSVGMDGYVMPGWRSVDIDDLDDFEYAQWLYQRHRN
ncbi:MAG: acylneuraminate cytidylyltransferase family protein [Burkholderiaceae bacterium]|uniref:acylneuraminate cytidylyltransferase family protein n=1 Tax=Hydrogenophaga sp. TaxID=1904254 RepID=UPI0027712C89|nr:acylneuraminate cytidylyltransferase family protein [Hydrogenophaga sp.]MDP2066113.1 acylneuraminate cytidylyltransferase family protein [Burkholderiaceae bacterium]MDZ4143314.1 acylneuraminate cytidylyltransferase family protein [Burkholderiales bacterium]MDZ4398690.1 acylneuraminate cytidylyltransferase family protein [Hydrogenophaga sp.]